VRFPLSARIAVVGVLLLAILGVVWVYPTDDTYIFLPNEAHPVDPLVKVPGERNDRDGGAIYFVDVLVRKATLLEKHVPSIHDGASLVPASLLLQQGETDAERRRQELRAMKLSQRAAAAAALRELGYRVVIRHFGARIQDVDPKVPAADVLESGDVVVVVDGKPVRTPDDLRRLVSERHPGAELRLGFLRDGKRREATVRTVTVTEAGRRRAIIGVFVEPAELIRLPVDVEIDSGNVGGPSAGLAFALDVMEELGRDVDHGYRVGATGSISPEGVVGRVGGLKQKTIGVRRSKLDVFLVPAGDNAREARRYAGDLRVIPVKTFRQALRALATLPRKRQE
jgi:PDZ domain-containing protein